ncbi:MAG: thioesterase family protein [Dehalococcoidia bacterium]|nr:thioesterase family protein [Dehalococcoidia bacterium]
MEDYRKTMVRKIVEFYGHQVPFHTLLGFSDECFDAENGQIRFSMRNEFVGNSLISPILHGGIICTILDIEGSFLVGLEFLTKRKDAADGKRIGKGGTIDLRVDYLMPGKGKSFVASGSLLHFGSKVASVQTELRNDQDQLIAVGRGSYLYG